MFRVPQEGKDSARALKRSFGAAAASLAVAGAVPTPLSPSLLLLGGLMGALAMKASDLANDPPRFYWDDPVRLPRRRLDLRQLMTPDRYPTPIFGAAEALDGADGGLEAGLVAFERAQGAQLAGADEATTARLIEARTFLAGAAHRLSHWYRFREGVAFQLRSLPEEEPMVVSLPVESLTRAGHAGLSSNDLDYLVGVFGDSREFHGFGPVADLLDETSDTALAFSHFLAGWTRDFGAATD